jgi:hypothetical protein
MQIHRTEDYRRALEELKHLSRDDPRRHDLEAAVAAYAQIHDNNRTKPGRPPSRENADTRELPEE